jgi:hypothetical protein
VVTLGQALRNAKARYAGELLRIRGIDEKAVGVATLYGLPMMPVRAHNRKARPRPTLTLFTGGAHVASAELKYGFDRKKGETATTYSLSGQPDSTQAPALRPALPTQVEDMTEGGQVVTGAMWIGGSFQDEHTALTIGRPATERVAKPPEYRNDAFLPARPFRINQLTPGRQRLIGAPLQYNVSARTVREWSVMALRVFRRAAADVTAHDAPLLTAPSVRATDAGIEVGVDVRHYAGDGEPLDVGAAYLSDARPGALVPVRLSGPPSSERDGRSFVRRMGATIPLSDRPGLRVFFQAAGANGRVASLTNAGRLYPVEGASAAKTATTLLLSAPTEALHRDVLHVRATLRDRNGAAIQDARVLFRLASARLWAITGAGGVVEADLIVNVPPRDQPFLVVASFVEDEKWLSSAASAELRVRKARVRIDRGSSDMALDDNVAIARVLHETRTAAGPMVPLGDRPVEIAVASRTFWFRILAALLPAPWLPTGPARYAVTAPDGEVLFSPDDFGLAPGSSAQVIVRFRENRRFSGATASFSVQVR